MKDVITAPRTSDIRASYDQVAEQYVRHIYDELQHKPLDRELLDRFAEQVRGTGLVCDLGCGPGHVARYLHERGVQVCGVDLSPGMIRWASQLCPEGAFYCGNMLALDFADNAWAGIAAFYAIVNLSPDEVRTASREMFRVLRPGGLLLLSFHIGEQVEHVHELWGKTIDLDFYFFRTAEVAGLLRDAGFHIESQVERGPYAPEVEYQSHRAYILARKATSAKSS
jgi:SAM-dependent methyltransferase